MKEVSEVLFAPLWLFLSLAFLLAALYIAYAVSSETIHTLRLQSIKILLWWIRLKSKTQSLFQKVKQTQSKLTESESSEWETPLECLELSDLAPPTSKKSSCSPPKAKASKGESGNRRSTKSKRTPKLKN